MAIVEMKRIDLLAMRQDQKKLLKAMQKMGCVEVSPIKDEALAAYAHSDAAKLAETEDRLSRQVWLISRLGAYNHQKAPFMGNKPAVSDEEVKRIADMEPELDALLDQAENLEKRSGEYKGQLARLDASLEQLSPWKGLDIPVEEIRSDRDVFQLIGTANKTQLAALAQSWQTLPVCVSVVGEVRDSAYFWLAGHASVREQVMAGLKDAGFAPAQFGDSRGTIASQMEAIVRQQEDVRGQQNELVKQWQTMAERLTDVKVWYDLTQIERDRLEAQERMVGTGSTFLMRGWVPSAVAENVQAELKRLSPSCSVEVYQPEEGDEPPVQLHNGRMAAPFESIVTGFALPSPQGIDPTAVMAPFYACLFGMMLSDAGYGLVMAIAIPLLVLIKKPAKENQKLLWVLFFSALATVVWGAIYNTWFGFNPMSFTILDPINNPMPVMVVCMGVGLIHLYAGLCVAGYMNFRRGKPQDAVFDQLSWILLVTGLIMMVVGGNIATIGTYMAIAGVAIIILFAGRAKGKNPFKRLIGGLGALYGATSWISDILSYMRLFGMGLATGVIGMVINQLVGMVFAGGIIGKVLGAVLFVGAHAFNLGINALGAYVHACRLQYIEFFGKFYEEGGVPFKPLSYKTRYVNVKNV